MSNLSCGIVGLPNVGKSTLFNALTSTQSAEAANYPFCTIEPNTSNVAVPDHRLKILAEVAQSAKIIPAQMEFVDIAGLVKGASNGDGLGNQFLGHIREAAAIIYVLRCFENDNIIHVEGSVDPLRDADIIETELLLADMQSLEKRITAMQAKARKDLKLQDQVVLMQKILKGLESGQAARNFTAQLPREEVHMLQLLTTKPVLYVCNVSEDEVMTGNAYTRLVEERAASHGAQCINISAAIEAEIAQLPEAEKQAFIVDMGLKESGLERLIKAAYKMLSYITYFTIGPKEARAWTIINGTRAPAAAGEIHTDFERGFIKADVIGYSDYVAHNGEAGARNAGKLRMEGKEYVVCDGDVIHFKFNV